MVDLFTVSRVYLKIKAQFEFEGKRKDTSFVFSRSFQYFYEHHRQLNFSDKHI